jgi:hypothetical protein
VQVLELSQVKQLAGQEEAPLAVVSKEGELLADAQDDPFTKTYPESQVRHTD